MVLTRDTAPLAGLVERFERDQVVGWVLDRRAPGEPVAVELVVRGNVAATCLAGQSRPDVAKKLEIQGSFGFRFAADSDLLAHPDEVVVRVAGTNDIISRSGGFSIRRDASAGNEAGCVTKVVGTTVSGWAIGPIRDQPAELQFFIDGAPRGTATANLARSIVDRSPDPSPRTGFRHTLRPDFSDSPERTVSVRLRGGPELANSPFILHAPPPPPPETAEIQSEPPADRPRPERPELELLGTGLGFLPEADPDVSDNRLLDPFHIFCRLMRIDTASTGSSGVEPDPEVAFHCLDDLFLGQLVTFDDIWFLNDATLRFRVSSAAADDTGVARIAFHQVDLARDEVFDAGASTLENEPIALVDARLVNPFFPLLMTALSADGTILGMTVLPFPSFCRGGAHHAELAALSEWPSYMVGLRRVSDSLLRDWLAEPGISGDFAIGAIIVDLRESTGAERIFSSFVKDWLAFLLDLSLEAAAPKALPGASATSYVEAALISDRPATAAVTARTARRQQNGALSLTMPADAIPTVNAVLSRRLRVPPETAGLFGSYLIAASDTGAPRLSVSMPPVGDLLSALQPAHVPSYGPRLERKGREPAASGASGTPQPPLAIRFHDGPASRESSLLFPTALAAPLIGGGLTPGEKETLAVSVVLAISDNGGASLTLLRSLAAQTVADRLEIVAVVSGNEATAAKSALSELFPNRHRVIQGRGPAAARINEGARLADGDALLVVREGVVLHDPRTVETLCVLGRNESVATTSCVIVREVETKTGPKVAFAAGGLFPTRVSFHSAPNLAFEEIESLAAFPTATYPVAGNSFRLALVRGSLWKRLGGLDANGFPHVQYDLDFSLRALREGFLHLCTSAVSASDLGPAGAEQKDALALGFLPPQRWQEVFDRVSILRKLH